MLLLKLTADESAILSDVDVETGPQALPTLFLFLCLFLGLLLSDCRSTKAFSFHN